MYGVLCPIALPCLMLIGLAAVSLEAQGQVWCARRCSYTVFWPAVPASPAATAYGLEGADVVRYCGNTRRHIRAWVATTEKRLRKPEGSKPGM